MKLKITSLLLTIILFSLIDCPGQQEIIETDPVDITAQAVLNRYIAVTGGKELFEKITDKVIVIDGTTMNQPVGITVIQKKPDKLFQEIRTGELKQTIYFNGSIGTLLVSDEKINIEGNELERLKYDALMNLPLDPESYGIKTELKSNVLADSIDCFEVSFILPSGLKWYQYYSSESGLKVKEIKEIQTTHGVFEQENYYSDYKEVAGFKFPFIIKQYFGLQEIDLKVKSISINTGVDDSEFEEIGRASCRERV